MSIYLFMFSILINPVVTIIVAAVEWDGFDFENTCWIGSRLLVCVLLFFKLLFTLIHSHFYFLFGFLHH